MNPAEAIGVLMDLEQQAGNDPKCLKTNLPASSDGEKLSSRERHVRALGCPTCRSPDSSHKQRS